MPQSGVHSEVLIGCPDPERSGEVGEYKNSLYLARSLRVARAVLCDSGDGSIMQVGARRV